MLTQVSIVKIYLALEDVLENFVKKLIFDYIYTHIISVAQSELFFREIYTGILNN